MQVNNLISKAIADGQVLKLPIKLMKQTNKNHIDINQVTQNGFQNLGGETKIKSD